MSAAESTTTLQRGGVPHGKVSQIVEYDFMRCGKCGRLITKPEMVRAVGPNGTGQACPCGSLKYHPVNLRWFDWLKPRVLRFAYRRVRGLA